MPYHMNETRDTKKQTPILSNNNIIMKIWRAVDCSRNNRVILIQKILALFNVTTKWSPIVANTCGTVGTAEADHIEHLEEKS